MIDFVHVGDWYINLGQVSAVEAVVRTRVVYSQSKSGEEKEKLEVRVFLAGGDKPIELHDEEAQRFMDAFNAMVTETA